MINVLLSRHGIDTGLPTTAGFRDVQGTVRAYKPNLFNMILTDVCPSAPHHMRSEIHGKFHTTLVNQGQWY